MGKPRNRKTILSQDTLATLTNTLSEAGAPSNIDNTDTNSIISSLVSAVLFLAKKIDNMESTSSAEGRSSDCGNPLLREVQDELDEVKQRSMKGNLILSSPGNNQLKLTTLIKSDTELKANNITFVGHIIDLIRQKYDVIIPEHDIQACHRLPNGSVIIRIWNRRPGSAWDALMTAIKTGAGDRSLNVFLNFHLTNRRNKIMYELRQLKKKKMIAKYYSDENGCLSFKKFDTDQKRRITFHHANADSAPMLTVTIDELYDMVGSRR